MFSTSFTDSSSRKAIPAVIPAPLSTVLSAFFPRPRAGKVRGKMGTRPWKVRVREFGPGIYYSITAVRELGARKKKFSTHASSFFSPPPKTLKQLSMIKTVDFIPLRGTSSCFSMIFVDFFEKIFFANSSDFQLENFFSPKPQNN